MTHPSLERRPVSALSAKEILEKPQQIHKYSLPLRQGKTVNTFSLFWNAIVASSGLGGLALGACVAIYSTFFYPIQGTFLGGAMGFLLGWLLGLGNGIIIGIVTRLWFFPLTNPKLHRQVLTAISIILCTLTTIVLLLKIYPNISDDCSGCIVFVLAGSLLAGLSMGSSTKSIARWYQKKSGL